MTTPKAPDLPPDYYLSNFRTLLDWVWKRYADLLDVQERHFVERFYGLTRDAQCLLVRLSSRKGPLFRRDKLGYSEISDLDEAAQELIAAGLLHHQVSLPFSLMASAVTKAELLALFPEQLAKNKHQRKEDLIQQLSEVFTDACDWASWTQGKLGDAFILDNQTIIKNLLLLFFGNAYQGLTEFVLQDLGLFRYENYSVDPAHRAFTSRAEIDEYWHLVQLRERLEIAESADELVELATHFLARAENITTTKFMNSKLDRSRAKLANQMAYRLEQVDQCALALQLYETNQLAPSRERRVRILEKQQDYAAAWALLLALLNNPQNEHELQLAWRMAPRLEKKMARAGLTQCETHTQLPLKIAAPVLIERQMNFQLLHTESGNPMRVEDVVRLSLTNKAAPCVYAENALLTGLFGLWLWPELFQSVTGAFANPFQSGPLDIYHENFVAQRPGIQTLWQLFESDAYQHHVLRIWEQKFGIANYFVSWNFLTREILELALHCIPAQQLKLIFQRLLFDIKNNRSGLPDLIQFYPAQKSYRLIEVKGPGDRLQDNQQRWLEFFAQHNIPAEVWYVRWNSPE